MAKGERLEAVAPSAESAGAGTAAPGEAADDVRLVALDVIEIRGRSLDRGPGSKTACGLPTRR